MARKRPAHTNAHEDAHTEKTAKASQKPHAKGGGLSEGFLKGSITALLVLVVVSSYLLGFQYGQISMTDTTAATTAAPAATKTAPTQAAAPAPTQAAQPTVPPPPEVPKTATPEVELFIMSLCPYGLQMQKAYIQAAELLGDKADMEVKWVSYLMHGEKERDENTRQYCLQEEQPEVYLDYATCYVESTNSEACQRSAGVDSAALQSCVDAANEEFGIMTDWEDKASWLSGRFAKYQVQAELTERYGVRGSPTMVINGKTVSVSRSAEAVKQAICNAFTDPPEECDETLNSNQEQPGAGPVGAGTTAGAAAAAGCAS